MALRQGSIGAQSLPHPGGIAVVGLSSNVGVKESDRLLYSRLAYRNIPVVVWACLTNSLQHEFLLKGGALAVQVKHTARADKWKNVGDCFRPEALLCSGG